MSLHTPQSLSALGGLNVMTCSGDVVGVIPDVKLCMASAEGVLFREMPSKSSCWSIPSDARPLLAGLICWPIGDPLTCTTPYTGCRRSEYCNMRRSPASNYTSHGDRPLLSRKAGGATQVEQPTPSVLLSNFSLSIRRVYTS